MGGSILITADHGNAEVMKGPSGEPWTAHTINKVPLIFIEGEKRKIPNMGNDIYLSDSSNWRIVCLRYFNPIGAHYSGLIGEDPLSKVNNIYPKITKVAIGLIDEIKIFGSDWPTKDGTGVRDYIHVMDLAEGHLSAFNYINKNEPNI